MPGQPRLPTQERMIQMRKAIRCETISGTTGRWAQCIAKKPASGNSITIPYAKPPPGSVVSKAFPGFHQARRGMSGGLEDAMRRGRSAKHFHGRGRRPRSVVYMTYSVFSPRRLARFLCHLKTQSCPPMDRKTIYSGKPGSPSASGAPGFPISRLLYA